MEKIQASQKNRIKNFLKLCKVAQFQELDKNLLKSNERGRVSLTIKECFNKQN